MNRPLVLRDDFWADFVNAFFLRPVYRTPTGPKHEESHPSAVSETEANQTNVVHPRHSALDDKDAQTLPSDEETSPTPSFDSVIDPGGNGLESFNVEDEKTGFFAPVTRADRLAVVSQAQSLIRVALRKVETRDIDAAKADLAIVMSFLRVATSASPETVPTSYALYTRAEEALDQLNRIGQLTKTDDAPLAQDLNDFVKDGRSGDYTEAHLDSDVEPSANRPDEDPPDTDDYFMK